MPSNAPSKGFNGTRAGGHEGAKVDKSGLIGLILIAILARCGPSGPGGVASDTARAWT